MTLTITVDLDATQEAGLAWATNIANANSGLALTPDEYAAGALLVAINSYVSQRATIRTQYGVSLYNSADPAKKALIDQEIGLPADYPTGKESAQ